jgi:hypothetical protein
MSYDVPHVPLSCNDLRAMVTIVTVYLTYLRHGVPPSPKRERNICQRLRKFGSSWFLVKH